MKKNNTKEIKSHSNDKIIQLTSNNQKRNIKRKVKKKNNVNNNNETKNGPITKIDFNNYNQQNNIIFSDNIDNHMNSHSQIKKIKQTKNDNGNNINSKNNYKDIKEKVKNMMKCTEDELNDLSYELALQYDKRTFLEFYLSLLKTKHNFINTFLFNGDYNSKIIKIDLFFIDFASSYIVNALFFDDDTMHNIYESNGSFDLENQLPIAIYSYLISILINFILNLFSLSNDVIIDFKKNKNIINVTQRSAKLISIIKIRTVLFFIISSLFLGSFGIIFQCFVPFIKILNFIY